ncbi:alpha/beta fold hydrolase [Streptomyces sp. NBRC 109706]|uniref:alpha/beta fold hydrolase n=1 Tax=Streptomyces sp. NBRC 109706 TaxID=1550035 RepID=UPI00078028DF|nr:alpha/beta hydrolase [Streptomyces sp. NBRC 109706]
MTTAAGRTTPRTVPEPGPDAPRSAAVPGLGEPVTVRRLTPGDADGARMTLLHGLATSGTLWDACLAEVRRTEGPETWVAELPWRGDGVAEWCARGDIVPYLADALRGVPGGPGVVVAHSMGAAVLLEFLNRRLAEGTDPFREFGIDAMVLVSPFYRRRVEDFTWESMVTSVEGFTRLMTEGVRVAAGRRLSEEALLDLGARVRDRVGAYGWTSFYDIYLRTPRLRTDQFTVPCLVVAGEDDFAALPEEARALAADLPGAEFQLLTDCGHFLMLEQAPRFVDVVAQFVSKTSAERPLSGPGPGSPWEHVR